jgi:hypothetical protein
MGAAALGHLVLVVREGQVDAAGVDVDGLAQRLVDHRRALDVPARTARAPGAVPLGLVLLGRLPQHEVGRVALVGRDLDAGAGDHLVQVAARQLAVVGEALGVEQHVALGGVGLAVLHQLADHLDDRADMLGGLGLQVRTQRAQRVGVLVIGGEIAVGDDLDVDAFVGGLLVDLVVDVRDVARIDHRVLAIEAAQHAIQDVEHHHRPEIADVRVVVDRRTADIHRHPLGIGGNESALLARHGVVDLQGHRRCGNLT